ncbi:PLP-dependent aminotransferase family protein [Streptomyces sp. 8L]|nr:PLP-dependent aminotransferase family protein [Streptomyces sp. 8L]MCA1223699.1 PLP-dependent aminotransferase family protein [Streptomyces sp. 8L]
MDALREAVRTGRLAPGTRLPPSRALAADLSIARNTVADAYAELAAEGWLTARQGSGTRVAPRTAPRRVVGQSAGAPPPPPAARPGAGARFDLRPGSPTLASFPRARWLAAAGGGGATAPAAAGGGGGAPAGPGRAAGPPRPPGRPPLPSPPRAGGRAAARRALTAAPHEAFGYGDPRGRVELRTALAAYLARARGVHADPDRVVVCAGFVHGLRLIGAVLGARGVRKVAVEPFGVPEYRALLTDTGLLAPALPADEHGTRTAALGELPGLRDAGAVLLTPAHQFPTGTALPPGRRAAVVDWARATGGLVLEDDYDGEFRYDRQPVGAVQSLDPERVVYFGTASKSLAPGLRIGWMVLPRAVTAEAVAAKGHADWAPGALDQLTLAEFITSGAYDRHVRAMRLRYRRRRDQLVAAVGERAPGVRVTGIAAGLHAVLELPPGTEESVVSAAAWQGLAVDGLRGFVHEDARDRPEVAGRDALVVGYATPSDSAWAGALDALCRVLP